jgi:hypothetical protein
MWSAVVRDVVRGGSAETTEIPEWSAMVHDVSDLSRRAREMEDESNKRNGVGRGPSRPTGVADWRPAWLAEEAPAAPGPPPPLGPPAEYPPPELPPAPVRSAALPPAPPVGARLFFGDAAGRPCAPEDAFLWTWEGAPAWFRAGEYALPAHDLTLWAGASKRCRSCVGRELRLSWQEFRNGVKHLRCDCALCGRFVGHVGAPPGNPDVEYQAVGVAV